MSDTTSFNIDVRYHILHRIVQRSNPFLSAASIGLATNNRIVAICGATPCRTQLKVSLSERRASDANCSAHPFAAAAARTWRRRRRRQQSSKAALRGAAAAAAAAVAFVRLCSRSNLRALLRTAAVPGDGAILALLSMIVRPGARHRRATHEHVSGSKPLHMCCCTP